MKLRADPGLYSGRMPGDYITIEVNGREADQATASLLEHEGWGHFTAMQVRGGRTRGLSLHLSRLEAAHQEVYGRALSGQEVRARIRHALGGRPDASALATYVHRVLICRGDTPALD